LKGESMFSKFKNTKKNIIEYVPSEIVSSELPNIYSELENINNNIKSLNETLQTIVSKPLYYDHPDERRYFSPSYVEFMMRPDYEDVFFNLCDRLDDESLRDVVKIIRRMQRINGTKGKINLFTSEEQEYLQRTSQFLGENILKISEGCFCIGEYCLPSRENIYHSGLISLYGRSSLGLLRNIECLKEKHIMDVGAYCGDSLLILSKLTNMNVHCFEAMSEHEALIRKTVSMNNINNAVIVQKALGSKPGTLTFKFNGAGSRSGSMASEAIKYTEEVEMITLDDYVEQYGINIGLIKVDIEGGEKEFLKGAKRTICRQKPILLLSIYHSAIDFYTIKPEIASWNLGYNFQIFKPINNTVSYETMLIAEI